METYEKNAVAVLDWKFDWDDWLAVGETISTKTVTVTTGITLASSAITDAGRSVTAWLSGGTLGLTYQVDCQIVTSAGRTEKRSILVVITDR